MKPAPPLPPGAVSSEPPVVRLDDIGRGQRKSFGLSNDPLITAEAERATSIRLHSGVDKVGVPLTDAEFAQFEVWKRLVDDRSMDRAMADNQNGAAEKRVSLNLAQPQVELWIAAAAPRRAEILATVPSGLDAVVRDAAFSGEELEALRRRVAEQLMVRQNLKRVDGTTLSGDTALLDSLRSQGIDARGVHRNTPQTVTISVDSVPGRDAPTLKRLGANAVARARTSGLLSAAEALMIDIDDLGAPMLARAERENDPGQLKAGLSIGWPSGTHPDGRPYIPGPCTSAFTISWLGSLWLTTAAHCGLSNSYVTSGTTYSDVPFWTDSRSQVNHNGWVLGTQRYFAFNTSMGRDVSLVQLSPRAAASDLYTLNPAVDTTYHYGLTNHPPYGSTWVCVEGASSLRTHPLVNGQNRDRCGASPVNTFNSFRTATIQWICSGDSGGLVHYADEALGIVYAIAAPTITGYPNPECAETLYYTTVASVLATFPGSSILVQGTFNYQTTNPAKLEPQSSPGSCIHRHANGDTGQPQGGWLQQIPSSYFPWIACNSSEQNWYFDPNNGFTSGQVWSLRSTSNTCMTVPGGNASNSVVLTQENCNGSTPQLWFAETYPGMGGQVLFRSMVDTNKCASVRDPYNGSDPHWIHVWDCFYQAPPQLFKPRD